MTKSETGRLGENAACRFLEAEGYTVTGTNVRVGKDEIDIIACKDSIIVFAEVKTRHETYGEENPFGSPKDAVGADKRRKLMRSAEGYLEMHKDIVLWPRIDVIEVYVADSGDITHIEHYVNAVNGRNTK